MIRRAAGARLSDEAACEAMAGRVTQGETDRQSVPWSAARWLEATAWSAATRRRLSDLADALGPSHRDGWRQISRDDVFKRSDDDPLDLFLAAMAWGFGGRGYGWHRTSAILNQSGEHAVARAVDRLREKVTEDMSWVWRAWSRGGAAKLRGLDTAFASKVAYFGAFDRSEGSGPLICDLNTAWAYWFFTDQWDSRSDAGIYAAYVSWAEQRATDLACRSDDIERALFEIGPAVRKHWKRVRPSDRSQ